MSQEQINEIMGLLRKVESVELKMTVPEDHHSGLRQHLGVDPLEAEMRQVYFFDTPDLQLDRSGVVVRARRIQGGEGDSVVKLRPVDPANVSKSLRRSPDFNLELDILPGGFVCSGSYTGALNAATVLEAELGERPIRKLYSREQRAFYNEHAPQGLAMDELAVMGPIFVLKLKFEPKVLKRRMVAEMWFYPDGSRIVELSTKTTPDVAVNVALETKAYLAELGIDAGGEQTTKTRKALDFFSRRLQAQTNSHDGN
jgi:hypothetical protein